MTALPVPFSLVLVFPSSVPSCLPDSHCLLFPPKSSLPPATSPAGFPAVNPSSRYAAAITVAALCAFASVRAADTLVPTSMLSLSDPDLEITVFATSPQLQNPWTYADRWWQTVSESALKMAETFLVSAGVLEFRETDMPQGSITSVRFRADRVYQILLHSHVDRATGTQS